MPHYLIRISASSPVPEWIRDQPAASLSAVRSVSKDLGGHLDSCWFTDADGELIALLHLPQHAESAVLEDAFGQIWGGVEVDVQPLRTLQDLHPRLPEEDVLVRTELWSDPVDLGSDLSFPASDPPGWMNREPISREEVP